MSTERATLLEQLAIILDRCAHEVAAALRRNPEGLPELRRDATEALELVSECLQKEGLDAELVPVTTGVEDAEALAAALRDLAKDLSPTLLSELAEQDRVQAAALVKELAEEMLLELSWGRCSSDAERAAAERLLGDVRAWLVAAGDERANEVPSLEEVASDLDLASALQKAAGLLASRGAE